MEIQKSPVRACIGNRCCARDSRSNLARNFVYGQSARIYVPTWRIQGWTLPIRHPTESVEILRELLLIFLVASGLLFVSFKFVARQVSTRREREREGGREKRRSKFEGVCTHPVTQWRDPPLKTPKPSRVWNWFDRLPLGFSSLRSLGCGLSKGERKLSNIIAVASAARRGERVSSIERSQRKKDRKKERKKTLAVEKSRRAARRFVVSARSTTVRRERSGRRSRRKSPTSERFAGEQREMKTERGCPLWFPTCRNNRCNDVYAARTWLRLSD